MFVIICVILVLTTIGAVQHGAGRCYNLPTKEPSADFAADICLGVPPFQLLAARLFALELVARATGCVLITVLCLPPRLGT